MMQESIKSLKIYFIFVGIISVALTLINLMVYIPGNYFVNAKLFFWARFSFGVLFIILGIILNKIFYAHPKIIKIFLIAWATFSSLGYIVYSNYTSLAITILVTIYLFRNINRITNQTDLITPDIDRGTPKKNNTFKIILFISSLLFIALIIILSKQTPQVGQEISYNDKLAPYVSVSPDDKTIVFSYYKNNIAALYTSNPDGSEVNKLTSPENADHLNPSYFSDGKKILFLSYPKNSKELRSYLYTVELDSKQLKQLTTQDQHITQAILSPDNNKIYFIKSGYYGHYSPVVQSKPHEFDVFSIGVDGKGLEKITNLNSYNLSDLSISPDGTKLYFIATTQITEMEYRDIFHQLTLKDGKITTFEPKGNFINTDYYSSAVSHDGTMLAFTAYGLPRPSRGHELFIMNLNDRNANQITHLKSKITNPCFFYKQDKILFFQDNGSLDVSNYQLMLTKTDGSRLEKINIIIPDNKINSPK